jgi:hypothetical protein
MADVRAPASGRLLVRAAVFAGVLAALVWTLGELVRGFVPWTAALDPHHRLLWDEDPGRSRIFLLGDSAFCSLFVDRPEDTIWSRLSSLLGEEAFPGALTGATGEEIVEEARLVGRAKRSGGGVAFVDVIAMRFLTRGELSTGSDTGYSRALRRRFAGRLRLPCSPEEFETWLRYVCTEPFFLLRNREATEGVVRAVAHTPAFFHRGGERDRVWSDDTELACRRFRRALERVKGSSGDPSIEWVLQAGGVLRGAGIRPVAVVCPFNRALVERCLGPVEGKTLNERFSRARDDVVAGLRAGGIEVIDLLDGVPSEGFADYGHTNARGDDIIARELYAWLASRGLTVR